MPSENIIGKFNQIDQKNNTNAIEQALPIMDQMIQAFQNAPLDQPFKFKLSDFNLDDGIETKPASGTFDPFSQSALPPTPTVDPAMIQPVQQASLTGDMLTPTERALLSPEEQAIRERQRRQV